MKINYPVKYALMPIVEQVGWCPSVHRMEREYDTVCYIVSKCYLINEFTKYKEDGSKLYEYEVVFPYQPSEFDRWKRVEPEYNLNHGCCVNSNMVDGLFDSYKDALSYALYKNQKLSESTWSCLPISKNIMEKIQDKQDEFDKRLKKYKILESEIISNTEDMKIGKNKKLDNVISVLNNCVKILSCDIYSVLCFSKYSKYIVYSISQEDYERLINLVNKGNNIEYSFLNTNALLYHNKGDDGIKIVLDDDNGSYCILYNMISFDNGLTSSDFNIDNETLIFYTTETMDDILSSYKRHNDIDLMQISGLVLKRINK